MGTVKKNTVDYTLWNNTLCEYFFSEDNRNRTMYLHVNDDLIIELGEKLRLKKENSLKSFCESVISYSGNDINRIFEIAYIYGRRWFSQGMIGFPPFLSVLAVTVLAASKMNTDLEEGIHGNNYYRRLRDLIQLEGSGKPRGFEKCNELWEMLVKWQKKFKGKYGYFNIFKFGTEYIGYARSQCLIRDNERELLYDFFYWAGLKPMDSITAKHLEEQLEMYLYNKSNRLSRFFFSNELKVKESLINLLLFELEKWDGTVEPLHNKTLGGSWEHRVRSYNLFLKVDVEGTLQRKVNLSLFGIIEHLNKGDINYTTLDGCEVLEGAIKRNVSFTNISSDFNFESENLGIRARFKAMGTYILRNGLDKGINGWIERDDIQLSQNHLILTRNSKSIEKWLKLNHYKFKEVKFTNQPNTWFFYVFNPEEKIPINVNMIGREFNVIKEKDKIIFNDGLKIQNDEWLFEYPPNLIVQSKRGSTIFLNGSPLLSTLENTISLDLRELYIKKPTIYEFEVNTTKSKCLLRNDYKNRLSFDYFTPEKYMGKNRNPNIMGTYIYENLEQYPPLIEYKGRERANLSSDGKIFDVPLNKLIEAPPFKSGRGYKKLDLDLVGYAQGLERKIDILFEYLSIRQMGNWKVFLEAVKLIFGEDNYHLTAYKIRKNLTSLGLVEFGRNPFSKSYNWKVVPPSAAIIPCETPMVYLTGGRTRTFLGDIKNQVPVNTEMLMSIPKSNFEPLSIIFIDKINNNMDRLGEFLDSINIRFNIDEDYFAHDLLKCLPSLSGMVHSLETRERQKFNKEWKVSSWDLRFHRWINGEIGKINKYENLFGQERCFLLVNSTQEIEIDKELGKLYYASKYKPALSIFKYSNYILEVRKEYHLPDLYERVLASCIGQCPVIERGYRIYRNVPYDIALIVSVRLGFNLNYLKRGRINE
ncbi:hypothetical protein [Priestia sp. TGN 0903]|uniref:hypothetical protein n=1 Tax=Priestia sp. TGN 0903 TaxID=3420730 RepID=UPI003D7819A9